MVSGDIYVLAPKDGRLLPELLPFLCLSERFFQHAVGTSAGSLSPRTNWSSLASFELDLPPLDQQRRIAEILWAVDEMLETEWKCHESILSLRKSAHKRVFIHGLRKMHTTEEGAFYPNGWTVSSVGDACKIENRLRKPINSTQRASLQGDYPYFGPTGVLDHINEYRIDGEYVLIGEDGDHFLKFDTWDMTQLVKGRFNVNNHAHLLQGNERCRTEWIFQYFKHRDIMPYLSKQGSGRLKLRKSVLEKIPLAIPPLKEQVEILDFLRQIDTSFSLIKLHLKRTGYFLCALNNAIFGSP